MRFLFSWHQTEPGNQAQGPGALQQAILRLEGFEAPAAAWESDILPTRIMDYDHAWLDTLCVSGKIVWGRFRPSFNANKDKKAGNPVRTTPLTFVSRNNLNVWKNGSSVDESLLKENLSSKAINVWETLQKQGASFFDDIVNKTKLFPSQVEDALGELISSSLITSDSYTGLRALLVPDKYRTNAGSKRNPEIFSMNYAGRWSLLFNNNQNNNSGNTSREDIETIAWALLRRYGVVFRKLAERENLTPPWRDMVRIFRTMEARGQIRGGRFVEGVWGEQFALPEAIVELRNSKKEDKDNVLVTISAADPLNLTGIITPGKRIPSFMGNRILYRDGSPIAFMEAREIKFLIGPEKEKKWMLQDALVQRTVSPKLRKYLGV
jgi:ATP-dependent Lhr-like helicase